MCNSMHIESPQRWSRRAICRDKPSAARLAGHGAGQECRKPGIRFSTVKVLNSDSGYSGYFSERALTSNMTPLEVLENTNSSFSGSPSCRRGTYWYCLFSAHTALDLRERPRVNKLPLKAGVKYFERWPRLTQTSQER